MWDVPSKLVRQAGRALFTRGLKSLSESRQREKIACTEGASEARELGLLTVLDLHGQFSCWVLELLRKKRYPSRNQDAGKSERVDEVFQS